MCVFNWFSTNEIWAFRFYNEGRTSLSIYFEMVLRINTGNARMQELYNNRHQIINSFFFLNNIKYPSDMTVVANKTVISICHCRSSAVQWRQTNFKLHKRIGFLHKSSILSKINQTLDWCCLWPGSASNPFNQRIWLKLQHHLKFIN